MSTLTYDKGTILISGSVATPYGVWDPRSRNYRVEPYHYRDLVEFLTRSKVPFQDRVQDLQAFPVLKPLTFPLRPYQSDALASWNAAGKKGVVVLPTGCHAAFQKVLMFDGRVKDVQDVNIGDRLMGPDSEPRTVLQLVRGRGSMVQVMPIKGAPLLVNKEHVLTLVQTNTNACPVYPSERHGGRVVDVPLLEYEQWSRWKKHIHKLFRVPVDFAEPLRLPVDPYLLGVLLGDGSLLHGVSVTTMDAEIAEVVQNAAVHYSLRVRTENRKHNKSAVYHLTGKRNGPIRERNPLINDLKSLKLWNLDGKYKFIPHTHKTADRQSRLCILAGLLDTDGSLSNGTYDYISKSPALASDVAFVARSLGFGVTEGWVYKKCQTGAGGWYHRLCISGDVAAIPCRVAKKKASPRRQKKNVLRTGFRILPADDADYYGFVLSGDGRYLLDDFTVTHNSGKTAIGLEAIRAVSEPALVLTPTIDLLLQWKQEVEERLGVKPGVYGAGESSLGPITISTYDSAYLKIPTIGNKFSLILADEVHHLGSPGYAQIAEMSTAPYRMGLTATIQRDDERHFDIFRLLGGVVYSKKPSDLAGDYLAEYRLERVFVNLTKDEKERYEALMKRFGDYLDAHNISLGSAADFRQFIMLAARDRGAREALLARNEALSIALNTSSKMCALEKLLREAPPDDRIIIFTQHNSLVYAISRKFLVPYITYRTGKEERRKVLEKFKSGEYKAIVSSNVLNEGINVPAASLGVLVSGTGSKREFVQRLGRLLRKHDEKLARLVELVSRETYEVRSSSKRKRGGV